MKFETQDYNDISVVQLKGEIDTEVTDAFAETVTGLISAQKKGIVLDMSEVAFIDSEGLEKMLWAKDYCDENNSQLRVCGLNQTCSKILEITRLENEFSKYNELADAVKSLR